MMTDSCRLLTAVWKRECVLECSENHCKVLDIKESYYFPLLCEQVCRKTESSEMTQQQRLWHKSRQWSTSNITKKGSSFTDTSTPCPAMFSYMIVLLDLEWRQGISLDNKNGRRLARLLSVLGILSLSLVWRKLLDFPQFLASVA